MTRDLLRDATAALSDSGHNQSGGQFTRERVVATLHENQRRGRARRALLLPLAAIFVGSTAFAGVSGSLSSVFRSALDAVGFEMSAPVAVDTPSKPALPATPTKGKSAARSQEPAVPEPKELEPVEPELQTQGAPEPAKTPDHSADAVPAPAVQDGQDGHELYRRGHRAHFKEGKPAEALAAYDAYLKQQPRGRFAVDARYNRALCLVRLGRHEEAEKALAPFANGDFAGYRQQDAQRLLDALRQ